MINFSTYKTLVENRAQQIFSDLKLNGKDYMSLINAMEYSTMLGGKRIRPCIMLEFYTLFGGKAADIVDFALALELIHTYSLIHDDLPCMDNDDIRRGKPSCHIAFGEDTALLAGDALLTLAFNLATNVKVDSEYLIKSIRVLSDYSGVNGMVGGQVLDLWLEEHPSDINTVTKMCSLKTGGLIKAAATIGCILAGADDTVVAAAENYAENIGIVFQIIDDVLDVESTEDELGKPIGSDVKNNKTNFVSLLGVAECKALAKKLTDDAILHLQDLPGNTNNLKELALELYLRKK